MTASTVSRKVSDAVFVPSLTVTVKVAVPVLSCAGVTFTVRFALDPPNTIFAVGTSVVFDELPVSVRFVRGVSVSPTVNAIAPVDVLAFVT